MPTPKRSTVKNSAIKKSPIKKPVPKTAAAKKKTAAAKKKPAAPKKKTAVPKKETAAPRKKPSAPKKKTASPRKKPSARAESAAPPREEPATYTLSELVTRHGTATEAEIFSYVTRDRAGLVTDGGDVATSRIETDCARLYGQAGDFYASADARQKQALRGFGPELLRIAVFAARRGQELAEARRLGETQGADRQALRQSAAQALRQSAVARRDQLAALLRLASGGSTELLAEIERKVGRIATPELLAQGLSELSALGRRFLKGGDAALKKRAAAAGLDAAFLDEAEAVAQRVAAELKAGEAARERTAVAQADVDLWDGVNLFLLERILELFEVAHAIEPTVPRLLPLSLRGWFGRSVRPRMPDAPPAG